MKKLVFFAILLCFVLAFIFILLLSLRNNAIVQSADHLGPTITISGKITCRDYKNKEDSVILITATYKHGTKNTAISARIIAQPGEYSLRVPNDFGDVYIIAGVAQNIKGRIQSGFMPDGPKGGYFKNPIEVKSSDIGDIDITLGK